MVTACLSAAEGMVTWLSHMTTPGAPGRLHRYTTSQIQKNQGAKMQKISKYSYIYVIHTFELDLYTMFFSYCLVIVTEILKLN